MSKNKWADRWRHVASIGADPADREMVELEARDAEARGTRTCGKCGCDGHYRPGVGAFQCTSCRALLVNGKWI